VDIKNGKKYPNLKIRKRFPPRKIRIARPKPIGISTKAEIKSKIKEFLTDNQKI
jgi:hypothetical protein